MGFKYNLNFNAKDDDIFTVAAEVKQQIDDSQQPNIKWIDITGLTTNK